MYQTLFALAAVVAFAYYAQGRQRTDNDVERNAIAIEADLAAADLAEARMAEVYDLAWDEEDTGEESKPKRSVRAVPGSGIGPDFNAYGDETSPDLYDDLDDVHRDSTREAVEVGAGALHYTVVTTVGYANEAQPSQDSPGNLPTRAKWVRVRVREVLPEGGVTGRPPVDVRLRKVLTRVDHRRTSSDPSTPGS